jgi:hypothetical protein
MSRHLLLLPTKLHDKQFRLLSTAAKKHFGDTSSVLLLVIKMQIHRVIELRLGRRRCTLSGLINICVDYIRANHDHVDYVRVYYDHVYATLDES